MATEYRSQYTKTNSQNYENNQNYVKEELKPSSDPMLCPSEPDYSVNVCSVPNLKEKIEYIHGKNSRQTEFIKELEDFLGDIQKYNQASNKFEGYVRKHIPVPGNAEYLVNEFIHSGYIAVLENLCAPGSGKNINHHKRYASEHNVPAVQSMLFGPNGTARQALWQWKIEEFLRGQHRNYSRPKDEQMAHIYDKAVCNTGRIPELNMQNNEHEQIDFSAAKGKLPRGLESRITEAFNRSSQLYHGIWYKGTKRLSGELSYQILEAVATELLINQNNGNNDVFTAKESILEKIIEGANNSGKDAFAALYQKTNPDNDALEKSWNEARKILNDYAEILWQERDTYSKSIAERQQKDMPGNIYCNCGRYYWIPKKGHASIPLIPEKNKTKLPGGLYKNTPGGYFWWVPKLKFRRRLIPQGQNKTTKDFKAAQKLQKEEWEKIQKYEPQLADKLNNIKKMGIVTKHKPTAVKLAGKLWREIKNNDPQTAAKILSDNRPQIIKPDMDKVWPTWQEQKDRLSLIDEKPRMPIIYPKQDVKDELIYGLHVPEKLENMVEKIQKVDWLARNAMLAFEDKSPSVSKETAIQSNGKEWTNEQEKYGKKFVLQGSTYIDRDTGRIRISIYSPGFSEIGVLAEEIYHIVYEIIRQSSPETYRAIQRWHDKGTTNGTDSTITIGEAFAKTMAMEESGISTDMPGNIVKYAQKIFSEKNDVAPSVIENVKSNWPAPQMSVGAGLF